MASTSGNFAYLRDTFSQPGAVRPIAIAASRPYLFIAPDRDFLVELPTELLDPLVSMLNLEYAVSLAWSKFDSESFLAANAARRGRYIDLVEGLWQQYEAEARPALYRIEYYRMARRWLPL